MMFLNELDLNEFGSKIGLGRGRLLSSLDKFALFMDKDYIEIVNFFNGNSNSVSAKRVATLFDLIEEFNNISNESMLNTFRFSTFKDWEILEYLESIKIELYYITKLSKFLRSNQTNYNFTGRLELPSIIRQNQTLEDVSFYVKDSPDYDNSWVDIAMRNDLSEVDYRNGSNNPITLSFEINSRSFNIRSVVDNIIGEKILGLDIKRFITFAGNDLFVLGYDETSVQSAEILSNLKKGDVPEFKEFGLSNYIGENKSSINLSTLSRELYNIFSSHDSFTKFGIRNISIIDSDLVVEFEISTKLGEILTNSARL